MKMRYREYMLVGNRKKTLLVISILIVVFALWAWVKGSEKTVLSSCKRGSPYILEPRFTRALSLLEERINSQKQIAAEREIEDPSILRQFYSDVKNCLDVHYCSNEEMGSAEGSFSFAAGKADSDRLPICVVASYREEDDIMTSFLLAHEVTHAIQYLRGELTNTLQNRPEQQCYRSEAQAFTESKDFLFSLTPGESASFFSRYNQYLNVDPKMNVIRTLLSLAADINDTCDDLRIRNNPGYAECSYSTHISLLELELRKWPLYQQQCDSEG